MTGAEVHAIRAQLGLTQVQLAQLLGVHPLTVSKWERDLVPPAPHQIALLQSFRKATPGGKELGSEVSNLLVTAGVALALFVLLKAAFGEE